jgi:hypothetical protein
VSRYFWTTTELAVVREHYPSGGVLACCERLPQRSVAAIYEKARQLGLSHPRAAWVPSRPEIDAAIRAAYAEPHYDKGPLGEVARRFGLPRQWVKRRALALGLTKTKRKEPPWSDAELALLERHAAKHPTVIARHLRAAGFPRSAAAVINKRKRLRLDARHIDHYNRGLLCEWEPAKADKFWLIDLLTNTKACH